MFRMYDIFVLLLLVEYAGKVWRKKWDTLYSVRAQNNIKYIKSKCLTCSCDSTKSKCKAFDYRTLLLSNYVKNGIAEVKDVLELNERVFSICDAWPLRKSYRKFVLYASYLTVHMVIMYMDLVDVMGDMERMVENIIDNTVATTTYFMLFIIRFNKLMKHAIVVVKREISENKFENTDERHLYLAYHSISDKFGKYSVSITAVIAVLWYLTPMLQVLRSDGVAGNGSTDQFVLPFRVHAFCDYHDDFRKFTIMYMYQFPLMFIALCHISTMSLIVNLVLHVCGKFSILSHRIQNISTKSTTNLNEKIREYVTGHIKLIQTTKSINSSLQIILLIELIQTSIRMAVLIYMMIINSNGDFVSSFTYALYVSIVTSMLYLYSFVGERLSYESTKVSESYYEIDWQNLSPYNQKLLLLATFSGRQTLHITAGKFYTFSLYGFIDIMKTSFGYVSLLRAVV